MNLEASPVASLHGHGLPGYTGGGGGGVVNEFITHKCKAIVFGLHFKFYICVAYTTQSHIAVYSLIQYLTL